jgi:FkbM family methyltransferase
MALQLLRCAVMRQGLMRRFCGSRVLQYANFTLRGTLNDTPVRVPVVAGVGLMQVPLWEQEPWLNRTLATLLAASPGAFLDVGVNLGQTLLKVKTLDPRRPYFGFEPNPACVAFVRRLVAANRFSATTVAPFGLSDGARTLPLFTRGDDPVDSSATVVDGLYRSQDTWERTPVALMPGDDVLSALQVGQIAVIKIDVEGGELEVVRGLATTLARQRPAVICEILPSYAKGQQRWAFRQPRADALVGFMNSLDYRLFRLLPSGGTQLLESIEPHSDRSMTNYAFVRAEFTNTVFGVATR